jgi:hypothetical protein
MLRGYDNGFGFLETFSNIKNTASPYLGIIADTVKDAIPRVVDPEQQYWIYKGELPSFKSTVVGTVDALSTVHPNYLLVAATFIASFFILYIKMKYPFWNQIPAMHVYDWHRRYLYSEKPYIIHILPKKTKYYEPASNLSTIVSNNSELRKNQTQKPNIIETHRFRNISPERQNEIAKLLQNHYLPSDRVFCSVQLPDLAAQCADAMVSTYHLHLFESDVIEGFITSRKINTSISVGIGAERYIVNEHANYIDYLCFNPKLSSQQKIRSLFHTHEYNERMILPDRNITLFKKEVELCDAIVPLVEYDSLSFYLRYNIEPPKLSSKFRIVRIQRENLRHLHDWMERVASLAEDMTNSMRGGGQTSSFRVSITAEIGDLIHLLQTNQMFAYALKGPDIDVSTKLDTVYAMYFFRNAHMKYEDLDGGDTLHATCAFSNTNDFELYFLGFVWSLREARKDFSGTETKMLMIDDIGHLRGIAKKWQETHDVILRTKCAYYFCNYVVPRSPYNSENVNILL